MICPIYCADPSQKKPKERKRERERERERYCSSSAPVSVDHTSCLFIRPRGANRRFRRSDSPKPRRSSSFLFISTPSSFFFLPRASAPIAELHHQPGVAAFISGLCLLATPRRPLSLLGPVPFSCSASADIVACESLQLHPQPSSPLDCLDLDILNTFTLHPLCHETRRFCESELRKPTYQDLKRSRLYLDSPRFLRTRAV